MRTLLVSLIAAVGFLTANCQSNRKDDNSSTLVEIATNYGVIKIKLYNSTPLHRDNFIKLVKEGYFNGTLFHRVIKDFMIQGGDPDSKNAAPGAMLGNGGPAYTIPAEFNDSLYHKKGALAAARQSDQVNPTRASSGSQFYIVQGRTFQEADLRRMEERVNSERMNILLSQILEKPDNADLKRMIDGFVKVGNQSELNYLMQEIQPTLMAELEKNGKFRYSDQAVKDYATIGGTPHLDGSYTVFGEVIAGLDIVDRIANSPVGPNDRPQDDVVMTSVKIVKK
jgi:peptidylprolyl isomerase